MTTKQKELRTVQYVHHGLLAFVDKHGTIATESRPFLTGVSSVSVIYPNTNYAAIMTERNVNARLRRAVERVGRNMRSVLEDVKTAHG